MKIGTVFFNQRCGVLLTGCRQKKTPDSSSYEQKTLRETRTKAGTGNEEKDKNRDVTLITHPVSWSSDGQMWNPSDNPHRNRGLSRISPGPNEPRKVLVLLSRRGFLKCIILNMHKQQNQKNGIEPLAFILISLVSTGFHGYTLCFHVETTTHRYQRTAGYRRGSGLSNVTEMELRLAFFLCPTLRSQPTLGCVEVTAKENIGGMKLNK